MNDSRDPIAIITSAHWDGDARLNRHLTYLARAGHDVTMCGFSDSRSRIRSTMAALARIATTDARTVILPDPELFFLGSLAARMTGKRPILDVHEDYPAVAVSRDWAPTLLKPLVGRLARLTTVLGRLLAWRVVVAAPELARRGDVLVMNLPEPDRARIDSPQFPARKIVYVGDVTISRGALEMVETLSLLDDGFSLGLIGRVDEPTRDLIHRRAQELGVDHRMALEGRLPHARAWEAAGGAVAGLCLLRPLPAYRMAVATKIWEYMAAGVVPVVSDLPGQAAIVSQIDPALACTSTAEAAAVIQRLDHDPRWRSKVISEGQRLVRARWEDNRPDLAIQDAISP